MEKENLGQLVTKMNCALDLERKIVGVKFLFNKEDYENADASTVKNKINYCVMVKSAMSGRAVKATGDDLACIAGARATGLKEIDDYHKSGQNGKRLGLYHDMATAKSVRDGMSYCDHNAYGIMVKPLNEFNREPDVVIIVTNPYNTMRIVQAYSYYYGIQVNYKMTGNQAICSESTAYPYLNNDINVSMLCIGTRYRAGWQDNELAVAFPFNRFNKITEGLMETINIMDNNQKKEIIERKLHENNVYDFKIKYNHNYYNDISIDSGNQ
ncbi:MAG TPA: DUF169 domain-containing protein [Syntrophomonadaceae bacterium]|nr:DUF169 domain-containing protein [Syntrophomonadaceae bacterium]